MKATTRKMLGAVKFMATVTSHTLIKTRSWGHWTSDGDDVSADRWAADEFVGGQTMTRLVSAGHVAISKRDDGRMVATLTEAGCEAAAVAGQNHNPKS